ncbi:glycosyl transferase family 2 [Halobacteriales archaeon SW_10_68_16]|jgi:glucosyl-3-phosphoglycerate synthase|nr:MAG: glycosyl transferase family 2 [Halobacteriales archaeon SW_10_68_16]
MEYVQERVATLHDFGTGTPDAPTDRASVVVPMTDCDYASLAAERVLSTLERVDPGRVVVPLRASSATAGDVVAWVEGFDLDAEVLWCTAPRVEDRLGELGLDGEAGKGRDVWLALGLASATEYVAVHDIDATSYDESVAAKLLFPLAAGYDFSKGYYARVEDGRLYGRLARLFVAPLLDALATAHEDPLLEYLGAFRYPLAGEFAATGEFVRRVRVQRGWGLEIGTLGEAYAVAGFEGSAQVDLGVHEHDHRSVSGPEGLGDMSRHVGDALFHALADAGIEPDFETLPDRYRERASALVDQYAAEAAFNGLEYDPIDEREQVATYADAIGPAGPDRRLPAWRDAPLDPSEVRKLSREAIAAAER